MANRFFHDYETFSRVDIKQAGGDVYARDPSTEVLMLSYALDDGPVCQWVPAEGEPMPDMVRWAFENPDILLSGFNVPFEKSITRHVLGYDIPTSRYRCTMVEAYGMSFNGKMEEIGKQMGLPHDKQKLDTGKKLINMFCSPAAKNHKADRYTKENRPEQWEEFKQYNVQDTVTEREMHWMLEPYQPISEIEQRLWELDQKINENGLPVDMDLIFAAMDLHQEARAELLEEMRVITWLDNPNSGDQLKPWLAAQGCPVPDLRAETIEALLKSDLSPTVRSVLEMKRLVGMTAPTKWKAFRNRAHFDQLIFVVRYMFQFAGASRTRRWSSRGQNLQNLKRPKFKDMDSAAKVMKLRDLSTIKALYGSPIEFIASTVRAGITAPPGESLVVADLASIESRVVGWMSDCQAIICAFAEGLDTYKIMAVDIFGVGYDDVTKDQRTFSKPVVLAGPYGQGGPGLVKYAEDMGITLTEDEAGKHVKVFRNKCHEIPTMWKWLESAIIQAILNGTRSVGYKVEIYTEGDFLFIGLPSGRRLAYHQPKVEMKKTPWGEMKPTFTYMGINQNTRQWCRLKAHAGLITENIVQAIARDILAFGLLNADYYLPQLTLRGHVHDEIIGSAAKPIAEHMKEKLEELMSWSPPWAPDLLLGAEGYTALHYRKD